MGRRRVFHIVVECPGITTDLALTANRIALRGKPITLHQTTYSKITLSLDDAVVGQLDEAVGSPIQIQNHGPRSFFTTVAGVTHEGRQRIVGRCTVGESLRLER